MNEKRIDEFEMVEAQLEGLHEEVGLLSKKAPTDAVNKFKLKFINTTIARANGILGKEYRPFDAFDKFDEDDLPTNSDVVLIVSQYLQSMDAFRQHNTITDFSGTHWLLGNEKSNRKAKPPKYFKN